MQWQLYGTIILLGSILFMVWGSAKQVDLIQDKIENHNPRAHMAMIFLFSSFSQNPRNRKLLKAFLEGHIFIVKNFPKALLVYGGVCLIISFFTRPEKSYFWSLFGKTVFFGMIVLWVYVRIWMQRRKIRLVQTEEDEINVARLIGQMGMTLQYSRMILVVTAFVYVISLFK